MTWAPRVDVTQHQDELVIRVDLPGVEKNDVKVNVAEDAIMIHGERHRAQEEERDGVYRTERNYGAFYRTIALPTGAITDQVKASFDNGVLEIRMPAAPRSLPALFPSVAAPWWLVIHDLDELEDKLAQVVVVVLGIAFLGHAVTWDGQRDLLGLGVATALVIAALSCHLRRTAAARRPSPEDAPSSDGIRRAGGT